MFRNPGQKALGYRFAPRWASREGRQVHPDRLPRLASQRRACLRLDCAVRMMPRISLSVHPPGPTMLLSLSFRHPVPGPCSPVPLLRLVSCGACLFAASWAQAQQVTRTDTMLLKTESFDRDPNWEGVNNRSARAHDAVQI